MNRTDTDTLSRLNEMYGSEDNPEQLLEVLLGKVALGDDGPEGRADRLALGRLQMSLGRYSDAEATLRALLQIDAQNEGALEWLGELYRVTDKVEERIDVLSQRIALCSGPSETRAQLRATLARALLLIEGHTVQAAEALAAALDDDPGNPDCRAAAEALVEHARSTGTMPLHIPAAALERALRAQGDIAALPSVVELRLQGEHDPAHRAAAMSEVASLLERTLEQRDFAFLWAVNALREVPGEEVIRAEAERLAQLTDNLDALQEVYEELSETVVDDGLRAELLKRIAAYVEQRGGTAVEAQERLEAAVAAGADDVATLRDLVRLTGTGADPSAYIEALRRLVSAASAAQDTSTEGEACAQLADVLEKLSRYDEAIEVATRMRYLAPHDAVAVATLERLLHREERWSEVVELLRTIDDEGSARAERLVRLLRLQLEQLQDLSGAVDTLEELAAAAPQLSTTISLGAQLLQVMAPDTSALAVQLRGRVAAILEPPYVAGQNWPQVALILRMRLEATEDPGARRELWGRLHDLFEKTLDQPEQAFMSVGRALTETPEDIELRDRAERIAAKLQELETLLGVYEDITDQQSLPAALRAGYAVRCGQLCATTPAGAARATAYFEGALELLATVPGDSSLREDALHSLERLYRSLGEPTKLASVLARRADLAIAGPGGEPSRRQMLFEAAKINTHAGAFEAAEEALRSLLALDRDDLPAIRLLAETYQRLERWADFADTLRLELEVLADTDKQRSLAARYELGVVLDIHLGRPDEALAQLRAILEVAPEHQQTRRYLEERLNARQTLKIDNAAYLQQSYERTGDWGKAIEALRAQAQEHERRGERAQAGAVLLHLGTLQEREMPGQEALAFGTLCEAFRYVPDDESVQAALERVAGGNELLEEVCDLYEETSVDLDQRGYAEHAARLREAAARIWASSLGELARAASLYESVLKDHPRRQESAEPLSDIYGKLGRWVELEALLRRRLMLLDDPVERAPLLTALAEILRGPLGRGEEALPLLMEIRRNGIDDPRARRGLIALHDAAHDLDELRPLLEEELAACRGSEDRQAFVKARGRLAVLYADELALPSAAIPLWEEMHSESPDEPAVLSTLERLYEQKEDWMALRSLWEATLERTRDPAQRASLTMRLSKLLTEHLDGHAEAIEKHHKVLELDPRNEASMRALQGLYRGVGRYEELAQLLRRMMRLTAEPRTLKSLRLDLADVLAVHMGRRPEGVEMGRRVLDIEPHSADDLRGLVHLFTAAEAWEELAGVLERQASLLDGAEKVVALERLAEVFETQLKRPAAAAPAWERLLAEQPSHLRAYRRLDEVYCRDGKWQKLIALKDERCRRLTDVDERVALLRDIGQIREERLGQKEMAFLDACRAFRERWSDPSIAAWMDRLAVETEAVEEVLEIYDEALGELDDEQRIIDIHLRMAELSWEFLRQAESADTHFRRVLEYDARNEAAFSGLVRLYEAQERWQDAVSVLEQRARVAGDERATLQLLRETARILEERAGDLDGAIAAHRRILEIADQDSEALRGLAGLYERREEWQSLIAILERQEEAAERQEEKVAFRARIAHLWETALENPEQAVFVHRSILSQDETYAPSMKALERLYTSLHRTHELIETYERMCAATDEPHEQVRFLEHIVRLWEGMEDGDLAAAINAAERILELDARHLGAIEALARLLRLTREWERLLSYLQRHIELVEDPRDQVPLYLAMGEIYQRELGRTEAAERALKGALEADPGSREALGALGKLYERSGNWADALDKLKKQALVAGATAEGTELQYRIGKINEEMLLDRDAARVAYERALEIDPRYLPALRAMKELARAAKENVAFLGWLKREAQCAEEPSEQTALHTEAGLFLLEVLDDKDEAVEELEAALAIEYDYLPAARALAELCFSNEQWERAEQVLDVVVDQLDADVEAAALSRAQYRLAYACERLGKEQKALKSYQRSQELDPTYLPGLEGFGGALWRAERYEDAVKTYQAILLHHRDDLTDAEVVDYYQQVAQLFLLLNDNDRARSNVTRALELDSSHLPSLQLLSQICRAQGEYEDAYETLMRTIPQLVGEERVKTLIEIGQLCIDPLHDVYRAIDAYEDANRQRPQDRATLNALFELYLQSRQAARAVEALEELVRIETDDKERIRLSHSLGEVYRDEMKNEARALQYFNAALDLDPTFIRSFQAIEELLSASKNWRGLEENYIRMLQRIPVEQGTIKREIWKNLAGVYRYRLKNAEGAAQAYSVLCKMEPDNVETLEALADLLARVPQKTDEAIVAYQRLVPLLAERPQRALHALVRLFHNRRLPDRAFTTTAVLRIVGDIMPDETKLYEHYLRLQPPEPKAALTQKIWDACIVHPQAGGPLATLSDVLWRGASPLLTTPQKDFGFEKKKLWRREDLDAPVPTFFVTQLKKVRAVLALAPFEVWVRMGSTDGLTLLPVERPIFAVGEANDVFREMPDRQLRFLCARQLAYLQRSFLLPRALGASAFQAVVDAAIRLVEPRYPAQADPRVVAEYEKALTRAGPGLVQALRGPVGQLLQQKRAVQVRSFLEGIEHSAVRAAYLATGNLELAAQLLRMPDNGIVPVPHASRLRALLLFAASDENAEARQRIGMSIPS